MKLIFCVDKNNGMMFFGKRQSEDRVLREWIINRTLKSNLWMSKYSAEQFSDFSGFTADDDYIEKAGTDDYCFIEDKGYNIENADEVILCRWNRRYQADGFFNADLKASGFKKAESENIAGSSHEIITIDIYKRS